MMTTMVMPHDRERTVSPSARGERTVQHALLACGVLASLLYIATEILGGLRYPGYSFSSQMISELMATGAPSETFVDPLFIGYGILTAAFGTGVVWIAAGGNRALRIAGMLLIAYAVAGFAGPTLFEMHPRGTEGVSDTPHIVLTGVLVLLTFLSMGFGAFAFGKHFRAYTFATMLTMIAFGALAGSAGARLAAGEPTPGFGILERVNIYASMLWIAVLAVALFRRQPRAKHATGEPS